MRWSSEADEILARVPTKSQRQVARDIEKVAKVNRGTEVCWEELQRHSGVSCAVVEGYHFGPTFDVGR